jgi:putative ABC transport system permease protein
MGKVTLRNLAAHKLRLALTGLSVILGVAFVAGTLLFTDTVTHSFDNLFNRVGKGIAVQVKGKDIVSGNSADSSDVTQTAPVPASLVDTLRRVDGATQVTGQIQGYAALVGKDGKLVGGGGPPQIGVNWTGSDPADQIVSGHVPQTPDEVAIDTETAKKAGLRVGDQTRILTKDKPQTFTIAGIIDNGSLNGATLTWFQTSVAQRLLYQPGAFSDVQIRAQSGVSEQTMLQRVKQILPNDLTAITGTQMRKDAQSQLDQVMNIFRTFLLVFAGISMFVGSFIIFNTFTMLVAQRTRELALLRAVGAARGQVTRTVLGEAVGVGVVGSTLGLALGAGIALLLQAFFKSQGLDLKGGLYFTPTPVIWSYVVGITVTVIAAYFPARRAAKIPPVAAMRDDVALPQRSLRIRILVGAVLTAISAAPMAVRTLLVFLGVAMLAPVISTPVVKVIGVGLPRLFRTPGRLAYHNAQRNPRRTAATAAALMIGLSMVTMVAVIGASLGASINKVVDDQFGADYIVSPSNGGGGRGFSPATAQTIAAVPGVTRATPVFAGQMRLDGKKAGYQSGDTAGLFKAAKGQLVKGSLDLGSDGILIDEALAKKNNWTLGSTAQATFNTGPVQTLTVKGIFKKSDFLTNRIVALPVYQAHTTNQLAVVVLIDAKQGAATKTGIENSIKDYPNLKVSDQTALKADARKQVQGLVTFLTIMLVLSIVIAAFGVINTIALSVIERTREIGLLRAVGTSRRQIRRMVRLEAVVIAVFGGLLGIALGVAFGVAIQQGAKDSGIAVLQVPYGTLIIYVIVAGIIGVLAALWPAWRAGRMDVLKAISTN